MLVEDNPDDEALARRALAHSGIDAEVTVVGDGAEALEYLFAEGRYKDAPKPQGPGVVFLDVKLPKLDGIEVLRRIRVNPNTRALPVVMLTSSSEERDVLASYNLGANSYIRKPVDFDSFTQTVCQLARYWLELNISPPRRR